MKRKPPLIDSEADGTCMAQDDRTGCWYVAKSLPLYGLSGVRERFRHALLVFFDRARAVRYHEDLSTEELQAFERTRVARAETACRPPKVDEAIRRLLANVGEMPLPESFVKRLDITERLLAGDTTFRLLPFSKEEFSARTGPGYLELPYGDRVETHPLELTLDLDMDRLRNADGEFDRAVGLLVDEARKKPCPAGCFHYLAPGGLVPALSKEAYRVKFSWRSTYVDVSPPMLNQISFSTPDKPTEVKQ